MSVLDTANENLFLEQAREIRNLREEIALLKSKLATQANYIKQLERQISTADDFHGNDGL